MKGTGILINDEWDLNIDPVYNADGKIESGLQIGKTTQQNQAFIIVCHPGEIKEAPTVGVGISDLINDERDLLKWQHRIRQQLEAEGLTVGPVVFKRENLHIDAEYNS